MDGGCFDLLSIVLLLPSTPNELVAASRPGKADQGEQNVSAGEVDRMEEKA